MTGYALGPSEVTLAPHGYEATALDVEPDALPRGARSTSRLFTLAVSSAKPIDAHLLDEVQLAAWQRGERPAPVPGCGCLRTILYAFTLAPTRTKSLHLVLHNVCSGAPNPVTYRVVETTPTVTERASTT
jgi:hypothetical protein